MDKYYETDEIFRRILSNDKSNIFFMKQKSSFNMMQFASVGKNC